MTYFSSRQIASIITLREFTRLCDVLDKNTKLKETKFDIIEIERNGDNVKILVELGVGNLKKVTLTGTESNIQQEKREQTALVKVKA